MADSLELSCQRFEIRRKTNYNVKKGYFIDFISCEIERECKKFKKKKKKKREREREREERREENKAMTKKKKREK